MTKSILLAATMFFATFMTPLHALAAGESDKPKVFFISDITPETLVKIYKALGKEATGRVAVKISTGESAQSNHLSPELIAPFVQEVHGTHTVDYAAQIGLGSLDYELIDITTLGVDTPVATAEGYDLFDLAGTQLLSHADSLDSLDPGIYFVNGVKTVIK